MNRYSQIILNLLFIGVIFSYADFPQHYFPTGISHFEPVAMEELLSTTTSPWYITDSTIIDTDYVSTGDIIVIWDGVLVVDDAKLTMNGQLAASGNGRIVFINDAHLHFNQIWVGQYYIYLMGNSTFEITDGIIDANGVMHFAELHDSSSISAIRTHFPDWSFRKIFDKSSMFLEDIGHVGDFMMDDSTDIHLVRCDTLMPWLFVPDGSLIDVEFPAPDFVEHFEAGIGIAGFEGVGFRFVVDSCSRCWWSLETFSGCSIIVRNSEIRGSCVRLKGTDTTTVYGICNYNMHDAILPLHDRHLEYDNTYVYWWNWYPLDNTVFYMDSCVFGELITKQEGRAYVTRSTHDGATVSLGTQDGSFLSFSDGVSEAFLNTFKRSTMFLENVRVTPLWPYQSLNIAHGHSEMLCVNCDFDSLPFAMDTAVVFYAAIDSMDTLEIGDIVEITGHAWLSTGMFYPFDFENFALRCSSHVDGSVFPLAESSVPVVDGLLGLWDTDGLAEGDYTLSLAVINSDSDSLVSKMDIRLSGMSISDSSPQTARPEVFEINAHPNPFNSAVSITVDCQGLINQPLTVEIFDLNGRRVAELPEYGTVGVGHSPALNADTRTNERDGIKPSPTAKAVVWSPAPSLPSGVYLVRALVGELPSPLRQANGTAGSGNVATKRIVYLK